MSESNPNCTDFCTGGGQNRGHPVVTEFDKMKMDTILERYGISRDEINEADLLRITTLLYGNGFGYHAIADFVDKPHETIYRILTTY